MTFELPKRKHFVHKAIEPRNLSGAKLKAVEARTDDIWEVKYDGDNCLLIKADGKAYAFSRQGEPVKGAMDRQLRAMESIAADNYVLFCEAWRPDEIHSIIDGEFRRGYSSADPRKLKAIVFDVVTLDEFMSGTSGIPYRTRTSRAFDAVYYLTNFGHGHLFEKAFQGPDRQHCVDHVESRRAKGEIFAIDGFMRKSKEGTWKAGAGSCGSVLKDKTLFTVDLKVEGLVEGEGKFVGMLGAYECTYKGQPQRVGGGKLTDAQRRAIWEDKTTKDGGIGSIIEVHALGESTTGLLREPRFATVRYDKTEGE